MADTATLLVEIGTEELPPKALSRLSGAFRDGLVSGLDKAGRQLRPAYSSGTLYAADHKGLLAAIDAESGRKLWEIKTKLPFTGGPGVSGNLLLMGTQDGEVFAFDASTGTQLWSATVTSEVLAAPAEGDGVRLAHPHSDAHPEYRNEQDDQADRKRQRPLVDEASDPIGTLWPARSRLGGNDVNADHGQQEAEDDDGADPCGQTSEAQCVGGRPQHRSR